MQCYRLVGDIGEEIPLHLFVDHLFFRISVRVLNTSISRKDHVLALLDCAFKGRFVQDGFPERWPLDLAFTAHYVCLGLFVLLPCGRL